MAQGMTQGSNKKGFVDYILGEQPTGVGYDYVDSISFAFDMNRYYQGSPNPRLEKLR